MGGGEVDETLGNLHTASPALPRIAPDTLRHKGQGRRV